MIYFIPWAILLAFVILAVPIAAWLDNRKMRAAYGEPSDSLGDEDDDGGGDGFDEEHSEASESEAVADEGGGEDDFGGDFGGDDFAEFEEVS